jgi:hypothetical protein
MEQHHQSLSLQRSSFPVSAVASSGAHSAALAALALLRHWKPENQKAAQGKNFTVGHKRKRFAFT